jgi:uncharacterized iron-regulated membrane protein
LLDSADDALRVSDVTSARTRLEGADQQLGSTRSAARDALDAEAVAGAADDGAPVEWLAVLAATIAALGTLLTGLSAWSDRRAALSTPREPMHDRPLTATRSQLAGSKTTSTAVAAMGDEYPADPA